MALWIQKFGGSVLKDLCDYDRVAEHVKGFIDRGDRVVVVVSALYGHTDQLLSSIDHDAMADIDIALEIDALLVSGELLSASRMSMALKKLNMKALCLNAYSAGIHACGMHGKGMIDRIDCKKIHSLLEQGLLPVIAGFQGVNEHGHFITLGRGGSDITSVSLATALDADGCYVYKDVSGLFSTDPKDLPKADALGYSNTDFDTMMRASSNGCSLIHPRAVGCALKAQLPISIKNLSSTASSTEISSCDSSSMCESSVVDVITKYEHLCLLNIQLSKKYYSDLCRFTGRLMGFTTDLTYHLTQFDASNLVLKISVLSSERLALEKLLSQQDFIHSKSYRAYWHADVTKISLLGRLLTYDPMFVNTIAEFFTDGEKPCYAFELDDRMIGLWLHPKDAKAAIAYFHDLFIVQHHAIL